MFTSRQTADTAIHICTDTQVINKGWPTYLQKDLPVKATIGQKIDHIAKRRYIQCLPAVQFHS